MLVANTSCNGLHINGIAAEEILTEQGSPLIIASAIQRARRNGGLTEQIVQEYVIQSFVSTAYYVEVAGYLWWAGQ